MKAKVEIGNRVNGSNGTGTISKIITKSTGYVEVSYDNGKVKKEMAFNLTSVDGEVLRSKPAGKTAEEKLHEKLTATESGNRFFVRADGSIDYNALEDFRVECEKAAWASIGIIR